VGLLVHGSSQLELQGSTFWVAQIDKFLGRLDKLKELYDEKLDEKRNFWGFLLTLVSLLQWPVGVIIGNYFTILLFLFSSH